VRGPAHCAACHTSKDEAQVASGEVPPLSGGRAFHADPLGVIYSKNLTPDPETGIGRYSDQQIARMLRWSVRPDGKASVQLLMPFANLSDSDLTAIISYLRAQPAVRNPVPENQFTAIGKVVKSFAPVFKPRTRVEPFARTPEMAPTVERGEYLARSVANCVGCHTKRDPISFAAVSAEFSGGAEMEPASRPGADPSIWFVTPNLTPAHGSALSKFPDRETFVARFQKGGVHHLGSPMPWESFGQMSADDLGALYEYLHSLPAQTGPTGEATFHKGAPLAERVASR
jgi:mono/diheme cytochrome c family protein